MFTYTDNTIVFTVLFGAFSGPIEVLTCVSTAWSP